MEMLAFILPLINVAKIKNFFSKWIPSFKQKDTFDRINQSQCCFCKNEIICAATSNCGHNFCYFCLASNLEADKTNFLCPVCKTHLTSVKLLKLEQ